MSEEHNEAEVLHPEREAEIAGRAIVMREYSWVEAMRLEQAAKPMLDELLERSSGPEGIAAEDVAGMLGTHTDLMIKLIATACNQPEEWVGSLGDADGSLLYWLFWSVNSGFFIRRLQTRVAMLQAEKAASAAATQSDQSDQQSETS